MLAMGHTSHSAQLFVVAVGVAVAVAVNAVMAKIGRPLSVSARQTHFYRPPFNPRSVARAALPAPARSPASPSGKPPVPFVVGVKSSPASKPGGGESVAIRWGCNIANLRCPRAGAFGHRIVGFLLSSAGRSEAPRPTPCKLPLAATELLRPRGAAAAVSLPLTMSPPPLPLAPMSNSMTPPLAHLAGGYQLAAGWLPFFTILTFGAQCERAANKVQAAFARNKRRVTPRLIGGPLTPALLDFNFVSISIELALAFLRSPPALWLRKRAPPGTSLLLADGRPGCSRSARERATRRFGVQWAGQGGSLSSSSAAHVATATATAAAASDSNHNKPRARGQPGG